MDNNIRPWYQSWWVIIIALLFCWPIGIGLIIFRNSQGKQSVFMGTTDKKKYILGGIALIIVGICGFGSSAFWGLFTIAGGIALILYADRLQKKAQRNRQYIELIVNRDETSLDRIASVCNVQYDIMLKELQTLINRNILKGAILDTNGRNITVRREVPVRSAMPNTPVIEVVEAPVSVNVVCPGCGAKHVIKKGETIYCDYCDTPITAE